MVEVSHKSWIVRRCGLCIQTYPKVGATLLGAWSRINLQQWLSSVCHLIQRRGPVMYYLLIREVVDCYRYQVHSVTFDRFGLQNLSVVSSKRCGVLRSWDEQCQRRFHESSGEQWSDYWQAVKVLSHEMTSRGPIEILFLGFEVMFARAKTNECPASVFFRTALKTFIILKRNGL